MKIMSAGLMALACSSLAYAQTAGQAGSPKKAPAASGKAAKTQDAKADGFGTVLPAGLTAQQVVALIAPGRDASLALLVGAKAWPHRANTFVAIACFARSKREFDAQRKSSIEPGCDRLYAPGQVPEHVNPPVYLGVVEYQAGAAAPKLLASYGKPFDINTSWGLRTRAGPSAKPSGDEGDELPDTYVRFDFAPYKITPTDTAIGLRLGRHVMYAGGGAYEETLTLFRIDGNKLVDILMETIAYSENIAGDWNKDGTRQHDVSEGKLVLSLLPHTSNGFADIQIRELKSTSKAIFAWDSKRARYMAVESAAAAKSR